MSSLKNAILNIFESLDSELGTTEANTTITTDDVIANIGHSSAGKVEGGRRVDTMIEENVLSGGNADGKDIFSQIYEDADAQGNIFEEIYADTNVTASADASAPIVKGGKAPSDEEDKCDQCEQCDQSDCTDCEEEDFDDEDSEEESEYEDEDEEQKHMNRYYNIIQQMKSTNIPVIQGGVTNAKPVKRVRIINAFPYILKVNPTYK